MSQQTAYGMIPFIRNVLKRQIDADEKGISACPGMEGWGNGRRLLKGMGFLFGVMEAFRS